MCVCVCVCVVSYPTYEAHAPYYTAICGLSGYHVFQHYLINGMIFETKIY